MLYVRHLAWLHAVPDPKLKKSRRDTFIEQSVDHPSLELPDLTEYDVGFVFEDLREAGLMSSNGMGPIALSWQEIYAWKETTEYEVPVWELIAIRALSESYVNELNKASERNAPPPYLPAKGEDQIDRDAVAAKIRNILVGRKANG